MLQLFELLWASGYAANEKTVLNSNERSQMTQVYEDKYGYVNCFIPETATELEDSLKYYNLFFKLWNLISDTSHVSYLPIMGLRPTICAEAFQQCTNFKRRRLSRKTKCPQMSWLASWIDSIDRDVVSKPIGRFMQACFVKVEKLTCVVCQEDKPQNEYDQGIWRNRFDRKHRRCRACFTCPTCPPGTTRPCLLYTSDAADE